MERCTHLLAALKKSSFRAKLSSRCPKSPICCEANQSSLLQVTAEPARHRPVWPSWALCSLGWNSTISPETKHLHSHQNWHPGQHSTALLLLLLLISLRTSHAPDTQASPTQQLCLIQTCQGQMRGQSFPVPRHRPHSFHPT